MRTSINMWMDAIGRSLTESTELFKAEFLFDMKQLKTKLLSTEIKQLFKVTGFRDCYRLVIKLFWRI